MRPEDATNYETSLIDFQLELRAMQKIYDLFNEDYLDDPFYNQDRYLRGFLVRYNNKTEYVFE